MIKCISFATPQHFDFLDALHNDFKKNSLCELESKRLNKTYEGNFGTNNFYQVMREKVIYIIETIESLDSNDFLVFLDADIHIKKDAPKIMLEELIQANSDILFQRDFDSYCAGMFITRINDQILNFFKNILECLDRDPKYYAERCSDQTALNECLETNKFDLKYGYLSDRFTTYGNISNGQQWNTSIRNFNLSNECVAFHANFTIGIDNKQSLLKLVRLKQ